MILQVLGVARLNLGKRLQKQIFSHGLKHITTKINFTLQTFTQQLMKLKLYKVFFQKITIAKIRFHQNSYPVILKRYKKLCRKVVQRAWNYEISESYFAITVLGGVYIYGVGVYIYIYGVGIYKAREREIDLQTNFQKTVVLEATILIINTHMHEVFLINTFAFLLKNGIHCSDLV